MCPRTWAGKTPNHSTGVQLGQVGHSRSLRPMADVTRKCPGCPLCREHCQLCGLPKLHPRHQRTGDTETGVDCHYKPHTWGDE